MDTDRARDVFQSYAVKSVLGEQASAASRICSIVSARCSALDGRRRLVSRLWALNNYSVSVGKLHRSRQRLPIQLSPPRALARLGLSIAFVFANIITPKTE